MRRGGSSLKTCLFRWALYFGIALILAIPQTLLLSQGSAVNKTGFFGYEPGWVADGVGVVGFWWLNLGLFLPILAVGLVARRRGCPLVGRRLVVFYLPFLVCFVLPNLVRLAPWDMDNMKIFLYWHLASSIVISGLLGWLWRRNLVFKVVSLGLLATLTLSGALDVVRVIEGVQSQQIFDANGIAFAEAVQAATPPDSVILHYPLHNHPLLLAGRHLVMGYEGHLWSHGIDSHVRKHDVQDIYAGAPDARTLLAKYRVDYVAVGLPRANRPEQRRNSDSIPSFGRAIPSSSRQADTPCTTSAKLPESSSGRRARIAPDIAPIECFESSKIIVRFFAVGLDNEKH